MRLSKTRAVVVEPDNSMKVRQFTSENVVEKRPVYDAKGKVVTYRKVNVCKKQFVSDEDLENRGIDSELFSIDNQLKVGVNMQPFTGDFIKPSLDQRMQLSEMTDVAVDAYEKQEKESKITEKQTE